VTASAVASAVSHRTLKDSIAFGGLVQGLAPNLDGDFILKVIVEVKLLSRVFL